MKTCSLCSGKGEISGKKCDVCNGTGEVEQCLLCGSPIPSNLRIKACKRCEQSHKIVLELDPLADYQDLILGRAYLGRVKKIIDIGYLVALNTQVVGLIRRRDAKNEYKINQEVIVKAKSLNLNERKLDLIPLKLESYSLIPLKKEVPLWKIAEIDESIIGEGVKIRGIVAKVQHTSKAKIFTVYDDTGAIECVAFVTGKTYSGVDVDSVVEIRGEVVFRLDRIQIEVRDLEKLFGAAQIAVKQAVEQSIEERAKPEDLPFYVESPVLERLKPKLLALAGELRKAVIKGIPILIRHHADCDGFIAGVAVEQALVPLLREYSPDREAEWHLFKRSPSRAPFYEMEDVVKDLNYAHEDMRRFGSPMPLVLIMDNGSTREDIPAISKFKVYGSKVFVVDHHYPGEIEDGRAEVDSLVDVHINPYLEGGDYSITAGCLGVELAKLINPEVSEKLSHLPGIACMADRVEGMEAEQYIKLAEEKGYTKETMLKIAECIDFEAFYLRFLDGKTLIEDLLGLGRLDRQRRLLEVIGSEAERLRKKALASATANYKSVKLKNGIVLNTLDIEQFSTRFEYPPPGKLTGMLHDLKAQEAERVVTIGYGRDFAILRATTEVQRLGLNLNKIVEDLQKELPMAGIEGGGHEVAGSVKFVEGYRKGVLEKLAEKIARLG